MRRTYITGILALTLVGALAAKPRAEVGLQPRLAPEPAAVLNQYCASCHNERLKTAGFVIDRLNPASVRDNPAAWEKIVRKLRTGTMPPRGSPRPALEVYDATATWL